MGRVERESKPGRYGSKVRMNVVVNTTQYSMRMIIYTNKNNNWHTVKWSMPQVCGGAKWLSVVG